MRGVYAQTRAASPAATPAPGNPRFPLFDGLRAIAALSVLAIHSIVFTDYFPGWQGAYARQLAAGVTVFFVISGFLLYRPFVAARLSGQSPTRLRSYARRRLLRIVPAYWLALTVLMLWPGLPGDFSRDWWIYFGFLQDFEDATLFGGLGTAWSLGTEVTFYALLPLYAAVLSRFGRSARAVLVAEVSALALLSLGSLAFRLTLGGSHRNLNYTLAGTFDWFALGMALAVVSAVVAHTVVRPRVIGFVERHAWLCWAAAFAVLTTAAWYWRQTRDYDAYGGRPLHLLWGAFAFFLVLPAAFHGRRAGAPHRLLRQRNVAWLGVVSYGVYLWHLPLVAKIGGGLERGGIEPSGLVLTALLILLVTAVAVPCAAFSYYVVERPLLRLGARRTQRTTERLPAAQQPVDTRAA